MTKTIDKVVFLSMYPWDDSSINDTVRCLVRAAKGVQKVYIEPPLGLRSSVTNIKYLVRSLGWQVADRGDVMVLSPPFGFAPVAWGLRDKTNSIAAKKLAVMMAERWGKNWRDETLVYVSSYSYTQTEMIKLLNPNYLFFHIVDDNFAFPSVQNDRRVWQEQERYFNYMMERSTVVAAVSPAIAQKYQEKYQRSVEVLRNGVDVIHFAGAANANPARELFNVKKPVLLFIGAINSWIDIDLLDYLADQMPDYLLLLVGPCFENNVHQPTWQRLTNRPNVRWVGSKPYDKLPKFIAGASVLLLPRTNDAHSQASDPLKLYEYLASGKPVVSTPLPSARQYSQYVYVADSREEFARQVEVAMAEHNDDLAAAQREFARQFAWPHKIKQMADMLHQATGATLKVDTSLV